MIITPNKLHPIYEKKQKKSNTIRDYQVLPQDNTNTETAKMDTVSKQIDTIMENTEVKEDLVNHPKHYTSHPSGVEVIDITEHMNFCRGNAIKYIMRAGIKNKNKEIEDLQKAVWYLNREIERLSK